MPDLVTLNMKFGFPANAFTFQSAPATEGSTTLGILQTILLLTAELKTAVTTGPKYPSESFKYLQHTADTEAPFAVQQQSIQATIKLSEIDYMIVVGHVAPTNSKIKAFPFAVFDIA